MILTGTTMSGSTNALAWVIGSNTNNASSTNKIAWSTNGINWIKGTITDNSSITNINSIAYNGTIWVAVGTGTNKLMTSTDGKTWTTSDAFNTFFQNANSVAWNGTYFVAAGLRIASTGSSTAFSTNGTSWTGNGVPLISTNPAVTDTIFNLYWSGSFWYAGGLIQTLIAGVRLAQTSVSTGASSWQAISLPANLATSGVRGTVSNGSATLVTGLNTIGSPNNGLGRSTQPHPVNTFTTIANFQRCQSAPIFSNYDGGIFLAAGVGTSGNSTIQYSIDGLNWFNSVNSDSIFGVTSTSVQALGWNGFLFVAGGGGTNKLGYSYDGDTWFTTSSSLSVANINAIASAKAPSLYPPL